MPGAFDVVIIDGEASNLTRYRCTRHAVEHLHPDGLLILDNADWHPETCRFLRDAGFQEVDLRRARANESPRKHDVIVLSRRPRAAPAPVATSRPHPRRIRLELGVP